MTSQVTSTYYYGIKLHQSCTVYCAVWCIDLYTKAQKVHGRAGSSESLKIWRGNIFSSERTSFAESVRGWGTSPPVMPPFPTAPSMAGGWGVSPLSVRSYGKYAAAGDISEQPSFLSDDVSIYNLQNACLCCYWIFFQWVLAFFFGVRNRKPSNHRLRDCKIQGSAIGCNKSGFDRFLGIVGCSDFRGVKNKNCPPPPRFW